MAGEDDKRAMLAESRTLNPGPERVSAAAFTRGAAGGFFDAADLVQVKYEMVRAVEADGAGVAEAARTFGLARQSCYNARRALAGGGLAGLIPGKPGPRGGHKATPVVVDYLRELRDADPRRSPADLVAAVQERFGITLHRRTVERALQRRLRDTAADGGPATRESPKR